MPDPERASISAVPSTVATARVGIEEDTSAARDQATKAAAAGLPRNHFAKVESGQIKLKQPDAMPVPRGLRHLSDTIRASMPRVRIEDLLQGVDEWCGFIRALQPLGGYVPRSGDDAHRAPLATLIAHGTNLGLAAMTERRLPDR